MKSLILCLLVGVAVALPVFDGSNEFDSDDTKFGYDASDEVVPGARTYHGAPVFRSGNNYVTRYDDDDDDDDVVYRAYYAGTPAVSQQKSLAVQTYSAPTVYTVPQTAVYSVAHPTTYSVPSAGASVYSTFGAVQPTFYRRSSDDSDEVSTYYHAAAPAAPTVYHAATPTVYSAPKVTYSAPKVTYGAPTFYNAAPQGFFYRVEDDDDDRFDFD